MEFRFDPVRGMPDAVVITPQRVDDERGWFSETYKRSVFADHRVADVFVQENVSHSSSKGTIRGLHYQKPPMAQGKLLKCLSGAALDVFVDIRKQSPTYATWGSVELDSGSGRMLWLPPGFANGLCTLEPETRVEYKVTKEYSRRHERVIAWNDSTLGIKWPERNPILSERDARAPPLARLNTDFAWGEE